MTLFFVYVWFFCHFTLVISLMCEITNRLLHYIAKSCGFIFNVRICDGVYGGPDLLERKEPEVLIYSSDQLRKYSPAWSSFCHVVNLNSALVSLWLIYKPFPITFISLIIESLSSIENIKKSRKILGIWNKICLHALMLWKMKLDVIYRKIF